MKYKIIIDSSCDIQTSTICSDKFEIVTVPISITVGDTEYVDDEKLDTKELISAMKASRSAFKTAAPSPDVFMREMSSADNVFCVTLSSKLSGTYNSARLAASEVCKQFPKKNVYVLDSLTASSAMVLIVEKLMRLLSGGAEIEFSDIVKKLESWRDNTKIRFMLQDFSSLVNSGRMNKLTGFIASALPVKILCGDNGAGEIKMYSKALGLKFGLKALLEFPLEKVKTEGNDIPVVITHCNNEEDALFIKYALETTHHLTNVKIYLMRGTASLYASDKGLSIAY